MAHEKNQEVISLLNQCAVACNHCLTACLEEKDIQMMAKCIKLDIDCAQICSLTASLISRGSEHGGHILKECVEICNKCAEECSKHQLDHCMECAEACRKCSEACRQAA
ncbi:MAG: four-helix bundle copper-binding protein [Bacteroidetes bacterium]|nr:four-helix bundle copper-binding protein [Bacteroidota bacterium]